MRRFGRRLASKYDRVHFCYEMGPTGYGLHRLITKYSVGSSVVCWGVGAAGSPPCAPFAWMRSALSN